jgi:hypothetical protein
MRHQLSARRLTAAVTETELLLEAVALVGAVEAEDLPMDSTIPAGVVPREGMAVLEMALLHTTLVVVAAVPAALEPQAVVAEKLPEMVALDRRRTSAVHQSPMRVVAEAKRVEM